MKRGFLLALVVGGLLLVVLMMRRPPPERFDTNRLLTAAPPPLSQPTVPFTHLTNQSQPGHFTPAGGATGPVGFVTNKVSAFTVFADWVERHLTGDPVADAIRGEALAWQRREALLELMETDPERAVQLAAPFSWRQSLPDNVTRHFEQWLDARGDFEVALAEGATEHHETVYRWAVFGAQRYRAFVYGKRERQLSQAHVPLHGIVLADKIALTPEAIRFLDKAEAQVLDNARGVEPVHTCVICGEAIGAEEWIGEIGGETRRFCSQEHAELANASLMAATASGMTGNSNLAAGGSSAWTQGRKDVLYVRVNFPDDLTEPNSETAAYSVMDGVNAFYVENSFNQTWLNTTVTPLLTLPRVKAWYATAGPGALLSDARAVARKAGFDTVNYDRDIVSHTSVPGFDWGGLGVVGGKGTWLQGYGVGVTAHELGHNAGLGHANFWDTYSPYTGIYGAGTNIEYGNIFDRMGSGGSHFGALFKRQLDWIPETAVHTVTTSGVYRIYPMDAARRGSGRFYTANVRKDFERDYWLEFRHRFPGNVALQNGILLTWSPWSGGGGAGMLDAHPATTSLADAPVVIGQTFSDRIAGVHVTPLARGVTDHEPWIDVRISLDDGVRNIPCCLKVEVEPAQAAPGQLVRLHATVADRDDNSFAYAWSFDDGTFSTNNSAWTYKSWTQPGEHVVRCEVSDMRGGRASANVLVTIGAPVNFRVTGVVLDEQGNPLEDVLLNADSLSGGSAVAGFTDSYGVYVLPGVDGLLNFNLAKYGYTFEPVGWQNPFFVTSNTANLNFIARAMTNVTLTLSTNSLVENVATTGQLTLTRSGSVSNDLTVLVFLSGSAGVPGDLSFTPPLVLGSNNVVIPEGTNRVVFNYSPVNNGTVEPTEVLNISVRETDDYVLTTLAERRITIIDDDQTATPTVSIAALPGPVLEHGMNAAGFVVSRTGSTAADLPVMYSVGGTTTAGVDYAALLGTVIIPAGRASTVIELRVLDDKLVEPNETVALNLTASPTYTIGTGAALATILDDDLLIVTVTPTGSGLAEPSSGGRFTIQRDGDITTALTVHFTFAGSASLGNDFSAATNSAVIPAGETSTDVFITALDDALVEGDETVTLVVLTNAAYDIGTPGHATLTLQDDERVTVTVTATDGFASEPGSDFGVITVSRDGSTSGDLVVPVIINGTALGGVDYVPLENPVVIPAGSDSVNLTVIPFEDLFWEQEFETVIVTLVASTNYNLGNPRQATVTIQDNDNFGTPAVGFAFATFSAPENESPGLPVILSQTSSAPISVQYQVLGGTASSGADYSLPAGTLNFAPGEWGKSIPLPIMNDTLVEADETIRVTLFNPTAAAHDGHQILTYTIRDDDLSAVSVTATLATASEIGPSAGNFRITRAGDTNASLLVHFQITGTASLPSDAPMLASPATIPAGQAFVDLPVLPVDDGTVELDEDLTLTLISAPAAKIVSPGAATITILDANVDNLPTITLTSTNQPNAVEGGGNGGFVLTRTGATTNALTVFLSTGGSAASGTDFVALPDSVTFAIGQSSVSIPVAAMDDATIEGEETVIVSLTARETYRVAFPGTATVTMQDNDQEVWVHASDFEAAEPGSDAGEFTVTRFGTTNTPLQVFLNFSGAAGNGVDFAALPNSVTIPAGSLTAQVPVLPLDDVLVEGSETVTLTLQPNAAYTLATPTSASVTIRDDEPGLSLTANVSEISEGSAAPAILTVRRAGDPNREVTARLAVGGTASYGVDYPAFETNVFLGCGIVAVDLLVFPTNEVVAETEQLTVNLLASPAYSLAGQSNVSLTFVDAGANHEPVVTITSPTTNVVYLLQTNANMILEALVTDGDGDPLTVTWTNLSGLEALAFGDVTQTNTTVSFTNTGVYVLRLTASDGFLSRYDEVTVVVGAFERLTNNVAGEELLHWAFDDGSGPIVSDTSGHSRNGLIQGSLGWTTNGISGGALALTGANNFVQATHDSGFLEGLTRFTISGWIHPTLVPTTSGLLTANDSGVPTLTLATRTSATCGPATNVFQGTLATSCGEAAQISAANALTNGWQHIALTWSNGLAPAFYVNGQLDQPQRHKVPLLGELVNCPKFLVGKGPNDIAATWAGMVDEIRVFSWQMDAAEIGAFVAANFGPIVEVATNVTVPVVTPVEITGIVTDDARPVPPGAITLSWSQVSGPLPVTLTDTNALTNTVTFTQAGDYVFRLIADDGEVKIYADLPVTVVEPTQILAYASDPFAAELGPDPGEFTFNRIGDLGFELTVFITLSGTASNGADYVQITQTNSITFPVDVDLVTIPITPFLDHRTEGEETVTITVVSNVIYTILSGVAVVTIQDSPYGQWNIAHFTLEELTDPSLSGETADFDDDGLINFVEYAANRDPKSPETNSPLQTTIELDPGDGLNHVTFTYQRRLPPIDVAYAAAFSTDLQTWQTNVTAVQEISATPDANGFTETVKARVVPPWPATTPHFVTVRVWLMSTGP